MFRQLSGLRMLHVPYRGSAPAITDLLGGQVDSMFDNAPSALPHVQAGKLRAIAITSARRSALLPDVPTLAESGDRKSTRLNSSHSQISYAVFCLKKKKNDTFLTIHICNT